MFGAGKRGVQLRRAVKLIDDLVALVEAGSVCRDERGGVRRPATPGMWAIGIEQMLANPPSGALQNHHYLRAVVYGLADQADAAAERQREASARSGTRTVAPPAPRETALHNRLAWLRQQFDYGQLDRAAYDAEVLAARASLGADAGGNGE